MLSTRVSAFKYLSRFIIYAQRGYRKKNEHWAVVRRKKTASMKALEHFDDFYGKVFGERWPSIRCALLSPHKFCALVNNYADSEATVSALENEGAVNLKIFFDVGREQFGVTRQEAKGEDKEMGKADEVQKLDETLQQFLMTKQEQVLEQIYPAGEIRGDSACSERALTFREVTKLQQQTVGTLKEKTQVDEQRVISPSQGLTSATLQEYVPATKLKGMEDWVTESQHYEYYKSGEDFPLVIKKDYDFNIPTHLNVFTYERGNVTRFKPPKHGSTQVLNYYLMDASSILPVLALNVKPGDAVLDMCAAPGGKSLAILQTLYPSLLVCNDNARVKRINTVLSQYLYDLNKWKDQIRITQQDGRQLENEFAFNKILVDVPCTTDRHSLHENDNNIFSPARIKERLRLPELQTDLLVSAIKTVSPGGTVVYSTCTLSPVQNDGVIHMALRKIWEETTIDVEVRDLTPALEKTKLLFTYAEDIGLRYGHLIVPFLPANFGPMYFCKLVRTK